MTSLVNEELEYTLFVCMHMGLLQYLKFIDFHIWQLVCILITCSSYSSCTTVTCSWCIIPFNSKARLSNISREEYEDEMEYI